MKRHYNIRSTVIAVVTSCLLASCVSREAFIGFKGVVYDSSTGRPLEGVYVMAEYREGGGTLFGHAGSWCVKTAGMYTGADGKFSLPASTRTTLLHPIKVGFVLDRSKTFAAHEEHGGHDFFMMPNLPDNPQQTLYVECGRPEKPADIAANIEYLEILALERRKYRGNSDLIDGSIHDLRQKAGIPAPKQPASR